MSREIGWWQVSDGYRFNSCVDKFLFRTVELINIESCMMMNKRTKMLSDVPVKILMTDVISPDKMQQVVNIMILFPTS